MAENLTFNLDVDTSNAVNAVNTFFNTFEQGATQAKVKLNKAFNQKFETEVRVEFKGGKLVAKEVQKMKQESNKLATIYKAVNGELGKTPNQLKKQKSILQGLLGDTRKFEAGTRRVTTEWANLTQKVRQVDAELKTMEGTMGRVASKSSGGGFGSLATKFVSIQTAANLATAGIMKMVRDLGELINTGVRMETLNLQMEAFTGGAAQAEAAMAQFLDIAANSPLNLEQVASAGKIMMAFGVSTEDAIQATEQLAVVAAATGGDINLLARNLGQVSAQGRAYTRDLTQFAIQGIPIWEELSIVTGESVTSLKEMATQGQIGFKEVQQAMANMTAEGTAFAEVAERMQETFAGRLAAIEAAFQNLAGKAVEAFNQIDVAMGGLIAGAMQGLASGLNSLADNMTTITMVLATLTSGVVAFFAAFAIGKITAIVISLGGIVSVLGIMKGTIIAALGAQLSLMGAMGPVAWASAAAGVTAAAVTFGVIKSNINGATQEATELTGEVGRLNEKELEAARFDSRVESYKNAREAADEYRGKLDIELSKLDTLKKALEEKHKEDVEGQRAVIEGIREKLREERSSLREAKAEIKIRYDEEKRQLDETLERIREKYSEEISSLQELGPKQKELYEFEKRKLQASISSGKLDAEALLRAQARLERMEQQEQIAKLRKDQAKEEEPVLKALADLEDERKKNIDKTTKAHGDRIKELESSLTKEEKALEKIQKDYKDQIKLMDEAAASANKIGDEVNLSSVAVNNQIRVVNNLAGEWREAEKAARDYAAQVRKANATKSESSGGKTPTTFNFAGGPISAGTTSWVNELGKEAFLSASGKLSMINDRGGKWTAPSSGTIIPAHLTKKLDIPTGGVNLNKSATAASSRAAGGGMNLSKIVSSIANNSGGDVFNQNVTVQSSNPTRSANNVMVEMARLRRRRFS